MSQQQSPSTDNKTILALQQTDDIFYAVRPEKLQAWPGSAVKERKKEKEDR
jgi:hypothetical protein